MKREAPFPEGKWDAAIAKLAGAQASKNPRPKALATLYRAVILAESGPATAEEALPAFDDALAQLANGQPVDVYRVQISYANFLACRAQDGLHNHAFEMASGVKNPLIYALINWRESLTHYQEALALADKLGPGHSTAVEVNLARHYSLLADLIRTLDVPIRGKRLFAAGDQAAEEQARRFASKAIRESSGVDDQTAAVAHSVLAQIALRAGDKNVCREHAERAEILCLRSGALAAVESVERMLGLAELLRDNASSDSSSRAKARKESLRHLLIAHLLSELLRERIPGDQVGLTRAGFFARRAYVNERIVESLIDDDKPIEALKYVELAKARGLQDVLLAAGHGKAIEQAETQELSAVLAHWPKDVVALEYFLATERAWVFIVAGPGDVTVHAITTEKGQPVSSRDLVLRVQQFIRGIDRYGLSEGPRVAQLYEARNRDSSVKMDFDTKWQDELHDFYRMLIPVEAAKRLQDATTVVIVPHHILHYFPFAALVTERDLAAAKAARIPCPKFFVEGPFSLIHAPSLGTWHALRQRDNRAMNDVRAVGIADFGNLAAQLPGVEQELEDLRSVFGNRVRDVLVGDQANKANVKKALERQGVLVVSTHGQKIPDHPLDGFLMCHPTEDGDCALTAREIFGERVGCGLVVLNACYGGFADRSPMPGDDLFGVQRALVHAGARTVVSGLWDIYDGTAPDIMLGFWKQIASGSPAPMALAESQRAYIKTWRETKVDALRLLAHPYYWAVFTVAGDDRTCFQKGMYK